MTMPCERTRAVLSAKEFMEELLDPKKTPRIPKSIRQQAYHILRHYPGKFEMEIACEAIHPMGLQSFGREGEIF